VFLVHLWIPILYRFSLVILVCIHSEVSLLLKSSNAQI
jgi:hypothetical protein